MEEVKGISFFLEVSVHLLETSVTSPSHTQTQFMDLHVKMCENKRTVLYVHTIILA